MAWTLKRSLLIGFAGYAAFLALFVVVTFHARPANEFVHWLTTDIIVTDWFIGGIIVLLGLHVVFAAVGAVYVGIRKLRIWVVRKRGRGYYKYKDPDHRD